MEKLGGHTLPRVNAVEIRVALASIQFDKLAYMTRSVDQTRYNARMTPTSQLLRARIASGTPIHYVGFNLLAGAEYVCIPSVVRELGLQKTVRAVASPSLGPAFEFRSVQGGTNDPGTWHRVEDCATGLPA